MGSVAPAAMERVVAGSRMVPLGSTRPRASVSRAAIESDVVLQVCKAAAKLAGGRAGRRRCCAGHVAGRDILAARRLGQHVASALIIGEPEEPVLAVNNAGDNDRAAGREAEQILMVVGYRTGDAASAMSRFC